MGEANDLTAAVEAARLLPDVRFVLMGDGKRRAGAGALGAAQRRVPERHARTDVARLAAESAACLTLFKDVPVLATNSPNKLFDTFAAGRPAIVNMDGWMRELVEQNEAGLYVRAGDARDLAEKVAWLRDNPEDAARMGAQRPGARRARVRPRRAGRPRARRARGGGALIELSYCVVNTGGRDYLLDCLAAIERTHPEGVEHELLVLDNASADGSAEAVRELHPDVRLFALERREGKADNDSRLLQAARGRYCLLLNEDSELHEGAARALLDALEADPGAAAAGAQLLTSEGEPDRLRLAASRHPLGARRRGVQHERVAVQSSGDRVREVGWVQSSAMLVRRDAARAGRLARRRLLRLLRRDRLLQPAARRRLADPVRARRARGAPRPARHGRGRDAAPDRGVPPQPRPLLPKARDARSRASCGSCAGSGPTSCAPRQPRSLPGRDPRRYLLHARQELLPGRGEGIREAAEAHNRGLAQ